MINLSSLSESEILGLTIIGEARGETIQGQVAVGSVVRNRVNLHKSDYHTECLKPAQFSCWNETDPNRPVLEEIADKLINGQFLTDVYLLQCMWVAEGIVRDQIIDNTRGALNYMTYDLFTTARPSWALNAKNLKTIGKQIFFNA